MVLYREILGTRLPYDSGGAQDMPARFLQAIGMNIQIWVLLVGNRTGDHKIWSNRTSILPLGYWYCPDHWMSWAPDQVASHRWGDPSVCLGCPPCTSIGWNLWPLRGRSGGCVSHPTRCQSHQFNTNSDKIKIKLRERVKRIYHLMPDESVQMPWFNLESFQRRENSMYLT